MANSEFLYSCSADDIQKAAGLLKAGHLVAFPTETVYGLGADATNEEAVKRVYLVKGRPSNHPLIVHVSSINALEVWAERIPDYATELARKFWPGPMTLILKRSEVARDFITGSQDSVGIRVPSDPVALALLTGFESLGGIGVAAPSANRFGQVSPTSSADVTEELGEYLDGADLILDGGRSDIGLESTIIDCTGSSPRILRPGAITRKQVESLLSIKLAQFSNSYLLRVSGGMEKHYSPQAKVLLNAIPQPGQAFFALSESETPSGVVRIGAPKNEVQFARDLYRALRETDKRGLTEIVVTPPAGEGLAEAILERLTKSMGGGTT